MNALPPQALRAAAGRARAGLEAGGGSPAGPPPQVSDGQAVAWLCQPQLAPVFSFDLAPPLAVPGWEFSSDLAPRLAGRARRGQKRRGLELAAGGGMSEKAVRIAWASWGSTSSRPPTLVPTVCAAPDP